MDSIMTRKELDQHLFALTGSKDLVEQWWNLPNHNWRGRTPAEIFEQDPKSVEQYIMRFCYGDYS